MHAAELPPLSLYIHLPWCVRKCPYCDFNSHKAAVGTAQAQQRRDYIVALTNDIAAEASRGDQRPLHSIFIGGGTPSLFPPEEMAQILDCVNDKFGIGADIEVTMEANPGAIEYGSFAGYAQAGINRLSIGAQSFNAGALERLGRLHGPDEIHVATRRAQEAGFERINLDLMYGLPEQSLQHALFDVEQALSLGISHISHYQLTLEPNTVFYAFPPQLPDEDLIAQMQEQCEQRLDAAGFARYEVSALAKAGQQSQHNLNYWRFGDYLAVGAGAHGKLSRAGLAPIRYAKPANPRAYTMAYANAREPMSGESIEVAQIGFEFMLNALRLRAGFSESMFKARTGEDFERVRGPVERAAMRGLLEKSGTDHWQPTALGFRFLNDLQGLFLT